MVFSDSKPFIREYVDEFTKIKEMGGAYRAIGKLFINSLYGRFGFRKTDEVTVLIPKDRQNYFTTRYDIVDKVDIGPMVILTYMGKPVIDYYKENNVFYHYNQDLAKYKQSYRHTETNVGVAAAITAMGRIRLYRDITSVLEHGGKVAYCDTDSIYALFENSPLGQTHGGVYWDPNDELANFEEGVFLAPKMYSIKNRHTHVKGVKLDSARHEELLEALKNKADTLKFETLQFVKQNYDIYLRGVDKEYSLWDDHKRIWHQEAGQ